MMRKRFDRRIGTLSHTKLESHDNDCGMRLDFARNAGFFGKGKIKFQIGVNVSDAVEAS